MAGKIGTLGVGFLVLLALSSAAVSAHEEMLGSQPSSQNITGKEVQSHLGYKHVWPDIRFGWKIAVGTMIAFVGAAFGSVGGVGGGGFFIPMLTLIIGFDQKSSIAVSKCMITGTATATVMYNLRRRHPTPTLDLPIIDYDLALLFQPVLVLGISIGVSLNVVLSDWMITILLFIVLLGVSTKSFFKGVETWKRETITKKNMFDASKQLQSNDVEDKYIPGGPSNGTLTETKEPERTAVPVLDNVRWKELGVIVAVWIIILALQIVKNYVAKCSLTYWLVELSQVPPCSFYQEDKLPCGCKYGLSKNPIIMRTFFFFFLSSCIYQIPVAVGVTSCQAVKLYKGRRVIASKGEETPKWPLYKLVSYCACGTAAGMLGGLLGLGGAFMLGPMFLEMGIPPQVSSATATFAMTFSSSMSVVEYYLLNRFPVPYGQHVAGKVIKKLGRASLIIFILAFTIFVSSLMLGGIGIKNMIKNIEHKDSLGFQNICT
ncbi:sulfite exporter TauE/SafE family protein 3-like isoform X2 [Prunus avium]|uniref:Sulfite exporter TauE/SafE family protein 3-like isoform X2 n=1 Tax=Prunus avium TaxID=42229 RepID=A0A6P5TQG8_PRUAV|nr:sulfite exporter TauE/SafE family protein 3-like isoform X2 [Prunus avium]